MENNRTSNKQLDISIEENLDLSKIKSILLQSINVLNMVSKDKQKNIENLMRIKMAKKDKNA